MRSLLFFFGIFAAVGAISLLLTLVFGWQSFRKLSSWEEAPGTLVGFNGNPQVEFRANGRLVQFTSSYSSSGMQTGDALTVHYPPGNPEGAEIKNFFNLWFLPLFFFIFTASFGGIGFYGVSRQLKKIGAKRDLFDNQQGKKLSLPISEIILDTSYRVNNRSPHVIVCTWINPLTNLAHEFRSDYIWYHPGVVLGERKTMDVYIDENDPTRYYMDATFLPKKAN